MGVAATVWRKFRSFAPTTRRRLAAGLKSVVTTVAPVMVLSMLASPLAVSIL